MDAWMVVNRDAAEKTLAWVSNGRVGARISRSGEIALILRPTEAGPENWTPYKMETLRRTWDGQPIEPEAADYEERWDLRTGQLTQRYRCRGLKVEVVTQALGDRIEQQRTYTAERAGTLEPPVDGQPSKLYAGDVVTTGNLKEMPTIDLATIEVDGPAEDRQAINAMRLTLGASIDPKVGRSVAPHGTSSPLYNGRVFWDAEMWVFPSLLLLDPARAKAILDYRLKRKDIAFINAEQWAKEKGKRLSNAALKFPWESGLSGNELATGEFKDELHVNGGILWALNHGQQFGLVTAAQTDPIAQGLSAFWRGLLTPREGDLFDLKNVLGVDEWKRVDNELYTNLLAQWTINGRSWQRPGWAPELYLPRSASNFTAYEGERQNVFKQANTLLAVYPLQYPGAEKEAYRLLSIYAYKLDRRGPPMSEAIHATVRARFGDPDEAYAEWRRGWKEFMRNGLFSESRKEDRTVFVTGAGGCLQTVLYGFAGFRIDYQQNPDAKWSMPLRNGGWLNVNPRLPTVWKRITLRGVEILGKKFTFEISADRVQVLEGDG
jgi:trehalose/maltose hydrolase-like predicted phosphorylase